MSLKYKNRGFSLIEMLIYTALLTLFMIVAVNAGILMTGAYAKAKVARALDTNAMLAMSRLSYEARNSDSIDPTSVLGSDPGRLVLIKQTDAGQETNDFYLENGGLKLKRNGSTIGNLTTSDVVVNNLIFRKIDANGRTALRLEIHLTANLKGQTKSATFYDTLNLRGSFKQ